MLFVVAGYHLICACDAFVCTVHRVVDTWAVETGGRDGISLKDIERIRRAGVVARTRVRAWGGLSRLRFRGCFGRRLQMGSIKCGVLWRRNRRDEECVSRIFSSHCVVYILHFVCFNWCQFFRCQFLSACTTDLLTITGFQEVRFGFSLRVAVVSVLNGSKSWRGMISR